RARAGNGSLRRDDRGKRPARAARRPDAPAHARRCRRPGAPARSGQSAPPGARAGRAALDDPLGPAGIRQDDARLADGARRRRALADRERGFGGSNADVDDDGLAAIARIANGDARGALNILEVAVALAPESGGRRRITEATIIEASQRRTLLYDKAGEEHYNLISALHKSLRDSDPDASLYWLTRMLEAGEDRLYIARRLVRFASEDVGNADPGALSLTLAAKEAYDFLGDPEGELALAQATLYLALAPKSNAVYVAYNEAKEDVAERPAEPVPLHIRNAPTRLMKDLGYGAGYQYAHD